ncbi:hypothetical protein JCM31826_17800 [Thermaurantimonas aggregans]|uniref:Uncharacterized protein n=1 Tax=Thermaurantimonas aggregans TaxID=2173829 RepID=A0A401XMT2_9FLAO|nr:hypothetical protein JCM31826_17800 [Thermaurantimonas aggregans]
MVGLSILAFFSLIYVNFNALVNFGLYVVKNFSVFNLLSNISLIVFFLFVVLLIIVVLFYFSTTFKSKIFNLLFTNKDFLDFSIQGELVKRVDVFSSVELSKRLKYFFFPKPKKIILYLFIILILTISFSFKFFQINFNQDVFDKYVEKISYTFNKNFFVEGDSIFLFTDFDCNGQIQLQYASYNTDLVKGKNFIGLASPNENKLYFKLNSYHKKVLLQIVPRPKVREFTVHSIYDNSIKERFTNITHLNILSNSIVEYKLMADNSANKLITGNFLFKNDTVIDFVLCNTYVCDTFQVFLTKRNISSPVINYSKVGNFYLISISDDHGIKNVQINGNTDFFKQPKTSLLIELDTNLQYTIIASNILNKTTRITIGNKYSILNTTANAFNNSEILNQYLESLESDILSVINTLNEQIKTSPINEIKQLLQNFQNQLNDISSDFYDQMRINQIKTLLKDVNKLLEEFQNISKNSQDLANELLKQKLQNTLNRYKKENHKIRTSNENISEASEINASEHIILEGLLLSFNNLSLDIEKNKYKNNKDLLNNSNLLTLADSLNMLLIKNKTLRPILSEEYERLKNTIQNNSDLKTFVFAINNLSVKLYQIIKNVEQNNINSNNQNNSQNNSNCTNPSNTGNSKKPGLSELIGEESNDGKEDNGSTSNGDPKKNSNNDSNTNESENSSENGKQNKSNKEKDGKSGPNGDKESLEELEKQLKDRKSSYSSILDELKRKIKWLDSEDSKRFNETMDNKRKGNFINDRDVEQINLIKKDTQNILYINRKELTVKTNVRY